MCIHVVHEWKEGRKNTIVIKKNKLVTVTKGLLRMNGFNI